MLLDSASLYFRAFYGVPSSVRAPDGTQTNAVRGFLDMISTLIERYGPTEIVACLDEDWRPTWRVELIPSYKTHRVDQSQEALVGGAGPGEAEPPGLDHQVPIMLNALKAVGITAIGAPNYEADDVIATLSEKATGPVDVVTGDRDLFQLIDDAKPVRVLYTGKGVAKLEIMNNARIQDRYGISAGQYADFAALRGDPSDGLPGVKGVGDKTAAQLLKTHGTIAQLLQNPPARLGSAERKVTEAREYLTAAAQVVRTARDVPLPALTAALPTKIADPAALAELAERFGLANVLGRLCKALHILE
ncbi:MAG: 5'-3' exonuclease [Corynebacteriales bacterium]|nr:5'-3' exonuclease [Mycobacteriales bacterium]